MNHEEGTDPWFYGRPQRAPLGCNRVQSTHFHRTIASSTRALVRCVMKKMTVAMIVDLEMTFYLCTTMTLFIGSYNTTTQVGLPWKVATQEAIGDRYAGDQLQVVNVANQGNAKSMLMWHKNMQGWQGLRVF